MQNAQGKNSTVAAHPCPVGYYCIEGSVLPVACPIGTFAPNATVGALNDCTVCSEVRSVFVMNSHDHMLIEAMGTAVSSSVRCITCLLVYCCKL
jgi:hypothetical protein